MIDVRIVCAHDAVETAKMITRLLEAEGHAVTLRFGRHALAHAEPAPDRAEAVIVIWSAHGNNAHYTRHAAMQAPAHKLIEITRAPGWPSIDHRRQHPIDFTRWNGARGGLELRNPWRELEERLRGVARACEPQKAQPVRAAMAMGAAGMVALGAAAVMRVGDEMAIAPELEDQRVNFATVEEIGADARGGPLLAPIEPFSAPEAEAFGPYARSVRLLETLAAPDMRALPAVADLAEPQDFRDQNLLAYFTGAGGSEP